MTPAMHSSADGAKAVLEAVQNVAAAAGRPVYVLLGQRTPCALDEVLALPHVSAVARGPREDDGVAVFAEGSVPPPAEMGLLTWHRKEEIHGG